MIPTLGYAAHNATAPLVPFSFSRRDVGPHDVLIQIRYCGMCHSDLHQARNEWGGSMYPMVPGHEIAGTVAQVGTAVTAFAVGDSVGVGCFVDTCRTCPACRRGEEQYCDGHLAWTYNGYERDQSTPTYGGYSNRIVVNTRYVVRIPVGLSLDRAAPLLCAGITTYSPLTHWKVGRGHRLAVVGLGGLGHMAVKLGAALGAQVTVLSRSDRKRPDALRLGASDFARLDTDLSKLERTFDFLLDTVSAPHAIDPLLESLKTDGTFILVGAPDQPMAVGAMPLILRRRRLAGSLIGGIRATQEMLDFCATHNIAADVEVIPIQQVNDAYERMLVGDVRYRFVIDLASLSG
ncbi:NADP-dependent alcohol dehydrogenase [Nitrospira sp.]|nr:NADP-dependent alcohol dehydrogenase [Nitrospira sp.]